MFVLCAWVAALTLLPTFEAECDTKDAPAGPMEYRVKAAFLFNFAKFVEWPDEAFKSDDAPIIAGVLGKDPFGPLLDQTVEGKTVHGRRMVIRRFDTVKSLKPCHILFISDSEKDHLKEITGALAGTCVLTVGETRQFARKGGIVGFKMVTNKVRFDINVDVAKRNRLKISSHLLKLSDIVRDVPGE